MDKQQSNASAAEHNAFYKELGVSSKASTEEIRKVYKKKIKDLHPDRGGDPEKFKRIQEIYEVLSDPEKRALYDKYGEDGLKNQGQDFDPTSFFGNFGFNGGQDEYRNVKQKCKSRLIQHPISLEEAFKGVKKTLDFSRRTICAACTGTGSDNPAAVKSCEKCNGVGVVLVRQQMGGMIFQTQQHCPDCKGKGKIVESPCTSCNGDKVVMKDHTLNLDIEKGVYEGYRYSFHEEGDQYPDITSGDVIIEIFVEPHKQFSRNGADLTYKKEITLLEALSGVNFVLTHLDGSLLKVKTKEGDIIKPGVMKTLYEHGMPFFGHPFKRGNLYIDFNIKFPTELDFENSSEVLEKVLVERLNKKPIKLTEEDLKKEGDVERYTMSDFKIEDENTQFSGGNVPLSGEYDDEEKVQECQFQ